MTTIAIGSGSLVAPAGRRALWNWSSIQAAVAASFGLRAGASRAKPAWLPFGLPARDDNNAPAGGGGQQWLALWAVVVVA